MTQYEADRMLSDYASYIRCGNTEEAGDLAAKIGALMVCARPDKAARERVSRVLADKGIYLYHTAVDELIAAAHGVQADPAVFPEGSGPFTVERLMELVRTLPPRSMRTERNAYLVEIELIAASLLDGVGGHDHQSFSHQVPMIGSDPE